MFTPFEYQMNGLEAIAHTRAQGIKKALVVMATGLGKTVLAAFDIKAWLAERSGHSRVLYLCHQNDILYQAKATFQAILGRSYSYGYYHGREKTAHAVDVLFASLQTMEEHKTFFQPHEFDYVIVDESHHSQADSFRPTIEYFTPQFLLGVTATPDRLDELDIREIFGEEVFSLPLEEAMARGYLAPVEYHLLTDEIQLSGIIETDTRKLSVTKLNRDIFIPKRDEEIAKIIARYVSEIENPRVINFCASVQHSENMAEIMQNSFTIHSRIPAKERDVRIEMFRQGIISNVLVVDSFNEGVDIPSANVLSFLRSTDSPTIFLQQLGRGLRKSDGKKKVVVLDFVANCERIKMIYDLYESVISKKEQLQQYNGDAQERTPPITLNLNSPDFKEKIIPILKVLERVRPNFYPTWQEASKAALALEIKSYTEYRGGVYTKDERLPAYPNERYHDFPGWKIFLGKAEKEFYTTWKKASKAACSLGITSSTQYREESYKKDPHLPAEPREVYEDFPGWTVFLGKTEKIIYETWQEASKVAIALGIASSSKYQGGAYKNDSSLPYDPAVTYSDFPGWVIFLGRAEKDFYETWKQASAAARAMDIHTTTEYKERYAEDSRLHSQPSSFYPNFPSWGEFLGTWRVRVKKSDVYPFWREAALAAIAKGMKSGPEYRKRYKEDPRLPSSPSTRYPDFPGWKEFFKASQ